MTIRLRVGPPSPNENNSDDTPKNGWVAFWQTLGWVVFVLCCTAYCCRAELVEVMK